VDVDTATAEDFRRAATLLDLGRPRDAAGLASRIVAACPFDPDGWLLLAQCLAGIDEPGRALDAVNRALGLNPVDPEAHRLASRILATLGMPLEAVRAGREAVRLAPLNHAAHANFAVALASSRPTSDLFRVRQPPHLKEAATHARRAIELSPLSTLGHFAAGYVAARSGKTSQARAYYRAVLRINPQDAGAQNNLALIDLRHGRMSRSGRGFAQTLATDPRQRLARRNMQATLQGQILFFHALAWLIYVCFSGIAANPESGRFVLVWSTRCTVAAWLSLGYGIFAIGALLRLDNRVRAFGVRMFIDSWVLKALAVVDAVTASCFVLALLGRGSTSSAIYQFGFIGIPLGYIGLVIHNNVGRRRPA
jgi:tetratricopeptide (TPR) repeat protein